MGRAEPYLEDEAYLEGPRSPRLTHAEVVRVGVLDLSWSDGATRRIDLTDRIEQSPSALCRMLLIPEIFPDFEIEEGGHGLRWINGVDFCADALRMRADDQAKKPDEK